MTAHNLTDPQTRILLSVRHRNNVIRARRLDLNGNECRIADRLVAMGYLTLGTEELEGAVNRDGTPYTEVVYRETGKGSDVTEMPAEKPARLTPAQRALLARLRDEYSANGGMPVGDFTLDLDDFRKFRVIEKLEELGLVEYHPGKGWTPVEATR